MAQMAGEFPTLPIRVIGLMVMLTKKLDYMS
jgi:hypothetical protein